MEKTFSEMCLGGVMVVLFQIFKILFKTLLGITLLEYYFVGYPKEGLRKFLYSILRLGDGSTTTILKSSI